jgi:murein L,D-transpeptidase YcbB/YkuD
VYKRKRLQNHKYLSKWHFFSPDFAIEAKIVLNDTNVSVIDIKKEINARKIWSHKIVFPRIYDRETNEAMKKFQIRHGLAADGVIELVLIAAFKFF